MPTLTTAEAAARLGITARAVSLLLRRGVISGEKRGRDWFAHAESVDAYQAAPKNRGGRPRKQKGE